MGWPGKARRRGWLMPARRSNTARASQGGACRARSDLTHKVNRYRGLSQCLCIRFLSAMKRSTAVSRLNRLVPAEVPWAGVPVRRDEAADPSPSSCACHSTAIKLPCRCHGGATHYPSSSTKTKVRYARTAQPDLPPLPGDRGVFSEVTSSGLRHAACEKSARAGSFMGPAPR